MHTFNIIINIRYYQMIRKGVRNSRMSYKNARKFLVAVKFSGIFLFVRKIFPIFALADLRLKGMWGCNYKKR